MQECGGERAGVKAPIRQPVTPPSTPTSAALHCHGTGARSAASTTARVPALPRHPPTPTAAVPSLWDTGQRAPAWSRVSGGTGHACLHVFFPELAGSFPRCCRLARQDPASLGQKGCQQCLPAAREVLARCLPRQGHSADGCRTALGPSSGPAPLLPVLPPLPNPASHPTLPRVPQMQRSHMREGCCWGRPAAAVPAQGCSVFCFFPVLALLSLHPSGDPAPRGGGPCPMMGGVGHFCAVSLPRQGGQDAISQPHHCCSPFSSPPAAEPGAEPSPQPRDWNAPGSRFGSQTSVTPTGWGSELRDLSAGPRLQGDLAAGLRCSRNGGQVLGSAGTGTRS